MAGQEDAKCLCCFSVRIHGFNLFSPLPNTQADTAAATAIAVALQGKSAKTPVCEKWLEEAYSPKLTELQKRTPTMKPFFKPETKVLAPDQLMTVAIKKPIVSEVAAIAQPINWPGGRTSCS